MRLLFLALLLLSFKSFAQKDSVEISIHILPELDSDFRNEQITVFVRNRDNIDFDTSIVYPFKLKVRVLNSIDSLRVLVHGSLSLGEDSLGKLFSVFAFLILDSKNEISNTEIEFPNNCAFNKSFKNKTCPVCKRKDLVIPIVWGLPIYHPDGTSPYDKIEYYPGGCDISDCDPTWHCKRDNIEF